MKQGEITSIWNMRPNFFHDLFSFTLDKSRRVSQSLEKASIQITKRERDFLGSYGIDILSFLVKVEDMHMEPTPEKRAQLQDECFEELERIREIFRNKEWTSLTKYSTTCDVERDMSMPNNKITRI